MVQKEQFIKDLEKLRKNAPLVHNITNYVVMNISANSLLSIGASPVMAHAIEEMKEMVAIAGALMINIGTLSSKWVEAMFLAGNEAKAKGIPVILDPVGAGATSYRTNTAKKLIEEVQPDIIRGNASEIMALAKAGIQTKGVDSTAESDSALDIAKEMAQKTGAVISISGKTDYITDGETVNSVEKGHPLMGKITGTGCAASSISGAFASINRNYLEAATEAMMAMGIAGEMAGEQADAPGTFQVKFLDSLYKMDENEIGKRW